MSHDYDPLAIFLSEEELTVRDAVAEFATDSLLPHAVAVDEQRFNITDHVPALAELGLLGLYTPEEFGGSGISPLGRVLAMRAIAGADPSVAMLVGGTTSLAANAIVGFGSEALKSRLLPPLAKGDAIGCFALTEPGAGSNTAAKRASCRETSDGFILTGEFSWITNGPIATVAIATFVNHETLGKDGVRPRWSVFAVPLNLSGVSRGENEKKMGVRGSPTSGLTFEDVEVPAFCLIGEHGNGHKVAFQTLESGRVSTAAQALGQAESAYRQTLKFVRQREVAGGILADQQATLLTLARMRCDIDAASLMVYRAARLIEAGKPYGNAASMAKLFATEMAVRVTEQCVRLFGGTGYASDLHVNILFRAALGGITYEGASTVNSLIIGRSIVAGNRL